ncbi:type II and III secretion system protein family protein [Methylobacterium sp. B4]|uniref:type II and III secretion system protein family protein n=1 Tax=Methylobacterium sp. B4 TaxID=1938755 RepID=UPI000D766936|nr:type II and III secretion system protein family protein [Methylobacterium sp. B4]PXW57464.1 pilus assembly protein CpaC [Methylobacterium sp. B4]
MTPDNRLRGIALALLSGACLAAVFANPAFAQIGPSGSSPVLTIGPNEAAVSRRVELSKGRSLIVDLPRDAKEVFVANPAVANAVVRSSRKLFLIGIDNGATSIFVMDADGRQIASLDVTIARDINILRQSLMQSLPGGRFDVKAVGDSLVLSGSVNSASEAQQAIDIANAFVGIAAGASTRGAVINNLTIRNKDQVMIRVTVVEVARTVLKQFGISTTGNWSALNPLGADGNFLTNNTGFPLTGAYSPAGNALTASVRSGGFSLQATLRAFEQAGVSRILAEPTLTAISGEAAKFTAGGEIPVPSNCSVGSAASAACTVSLTYKPYGVSLAFTPVVLAENRISIRVATDVTELDPQNAFSYNLNGRVVPVPATTRRNSETTVELASGATMMTAGLIQQKSKGTVNGLPGLMNLPILGALFRSRDYQRDETELMIMVTPYIAQPMEARQVQRPDDGFVDAPDGQAVLLGRLNKIYGTVGGSTLGPSYRGRVGFIAD